MCQEETLIRRSGDFPPTMLHGGVPEHHGRAEQKITDGQHTHHTHAHFEPSLGKPFQTRLSIQLSPAVLFLHIEPVRFLLNALWSLSHCRYPATLEIFSP